MNQTKKCKRIGFLLFAFFGPTADDRRETKAQDYLERTPGPAWKRGRTTETRRRAHHGPRESSETTARAQGRFCRDQGREAWPGKGQRGARPTARHSGPVQGLHAWPPAVRVRAPAALNLVKRAESRRERSVQTPGLRGCGSVSPESHTHTEPAAVSTWARLPSHQSPEAGRKKAASPHDTGPWRQLAPPRLPPRPCLRSGPSREER